MRNIQIKEAVRITEPGMNELDSTQVREKETGTSPADKARVPTRKKPALSAKLKRRLASGILVTDVSSGSFKYVYIIKKKGKISVTEFGDFSKEQLDVESEDIRDLYRAALVRFESETGISVRDILVISPHIDFFLRKLDLPLTKKSEIERAAKWEINKRIPIEVEESYVKIKKSGEKDGKRNLTVGAVPRNQINYWQFLDEKLIGVVPTAVALVPAGPHAISEDLTYCYVFYDEAYLSIGFYNSGGLLYHHPIVEEASINIFERGDPFFDRSKIVDELSNSIEVFYNRFPSKRVAGIVLFASSEEISRLAPMINENIVIDVVPADITDVVDEYHGDKELGPKYFPLLGAARIEKRDFIFLPKTLEDNIKIRIIRKVVYYGLSVGILTMLLLFVFLFAGANINKYRLKNVINQTSRIESSMAFTKCREYVERSKTMTALINRFKAADDQFSESYDAFGYLTPENIYLNNISTKIDAGHIRIEVAGYFDGEVSGADMAILDFMDNLKAFGLKQIQLNRLGHKLSGNSKTESFTITGRME